MALLSKQSDTGDALQQELTDSLNSIRERALAREEVVEARLTSLEAESKVLSDVIFAASPRS